MAKKKSKKVKKDVAVLKKSETTRKLKDPDPNSDDFMFDAVDKFHNQKDKILLDGGAEAASDDGMSEGEEAEEVYGLTSDEEEEDEENEEYGDERDEEEDSEEEDTDLEKGLPNDKAWGRGKKAFYDGDVDDEDVYANDEEAREVTAEEEREAITLQKRLHGKLSEEDFQTFEVPTGEEENEQKEEASVKKDLSTLTKRERMELFVKDSPEYLGLLEEFRERMDEVIRVYEPLMQMVKSGKIPSKQGQEYVALRHSLLMNYCVNLSFYFQLKACKERVTNHPVIQRIMQHKELLKKLDPVDERLRPEMEQLIAQHEVDKQQITAAKEGEEDKSSKKSKGKHGAKVASEKTEEGEEGETRKKKPKRKKKASQFEDDSDDGGVEGQGMDPLEYYNQIKTQVQAKKAKKASIEENEDAPVDGGEVDEDGKRSITYEMQKNKGLIRKRKKELRNPRIKHKMKFQKAKIKHKSQVREVKSELQRYGGETTGIKTSLSRSVALKS